MQVLYMASQLKSKRQHTFRGMKTRSKHGHAARQGEDNYFLCLSHHNAQWLSERTALTGHLHPVSRLLAGGPGLLLLCSR